ncbi:MAG: hypothetical protein QM756_18800 [Polyangiaceae bacterium]
MRRNIVFVVLLALLGVLGSSLLLGASKTRAAARAWFEGGAAPLPSASQAAVASAAPSASVAAPAPSASAAEPKPVVDRSLAVVGMGWELLAPGLLAAEGFKSTPSSAFGNADVRVSLSIANTLADVERALAAGGASNGADVAVLPLSELVAAYERLRALEPRVFFVSGWSQGRDRLTGAPLSKLPAAGDITLGYAGGADSLGLGLLTLDMAGVALERVKLAERDSGALLRASSGVVVDSGSPKQEDVALSTREATRLLPYVLVAARPLLDEREAVLAAFVRGWLGGTDALLKDRAKASRTLAALEGAPEAIGLLHALGDIEPIRLYENAALLGLSGRSALSAEWLCDSQFRVRRAAHVSQASTSESSLVDGRVVARLVRSQPSLVQAPEAPKRRPGGSVVLLERSFAKDDEQAVSDALGLLAAVFPRHDLRLTLSGKSDKVHAEWLDRAAARYDLDRARLSVGKAPARPGRAVLLEVLRAP